MPPQDQPEAPRLHLLKLCVGVDTPEDLARHIAARADPEAPTRHVTRQTPRRADNLLAGGSLYWVMRGAIAARQVIWGLEPVEMGDGAPHCAIVMAPTLIRVKSKPKRPFQGWRYLAPADAPDDRGPVRPDDAELPPALRAALSDYGIL